MSDEKNWGRECAEDWAEAVSMVGYNPPPSLEDAFEAGWNTRETWAEDMRNPTPPDAIREDEAAKYRALVEAARAHLNQLPRDEDDFVDDMTYGMTASEAHDWWGSFARLAAVTPAPTTTGETP